MTVSLCPLCQSSRLMLIDDHVECMEWINEAYCSFSAPASASLLIEAVMAHHMRPLAEPHAFKANPDYPGQCDEPVGDPVQPCNRPKECHR